MTELLESPVVRLGAGILGIPLPPPFPSEYDEHITQLESAADRTKRAAGDLDDELRLLLLQNEGAGAEAGRTSLTGEDGPLRRLQELAADQQRTAVALRAFKGLSTVVWGAIGVAAAGVGAAAVWAYQTGGLSIAGTVARAQAQIRRVLAQFRAAAKQLFSALLEQVAKPLTRLEGRRIQAKVDALASHLHEEWRAPRRLKDGTFEPRWKKTTDPKYVRKHGEDVDIANTDYKDLPREWRYENEATARVVVEQIAGARKRKVDLDVEEASKNVHIAWLERNGEWAPPEQKLPFEELSAEEQDKDRVMVLKGRELFEGKGRFGRR
jgi:hypothetical protein